MLVLRKFRFWAFAAAFVLTPSASAFAQSESCTVDASDPIGRTISEVVSNSDEIWIAEVSSFQLSNSVGAPFGQYEIDLIEILKSDVRRRERSDVRQIFGARPYIIEPDHYQEAQARYMRTPGVFNPAEHGKAFVNGECVVFFRGKLDYKYLFFMRNNAIYGYVVIRHPESDRLLRDIRAILEPPC